jgi:hypothetical protein
MARGREVHVSHQGGRPSLARRAHSAQAADPERRPDDAVFDASGAIVDGVILLDGAAGSATDLVQPAFLGWREMISQAIRSDPAWKNGDYTKHSAREAGSKRTFPCRRS